MVTRNREEKVFREKPVPELIFSPYIPHGYTETESGPPR
jgi:hypothetical protein